jgi:hypothetical protein
VARRAPGRNRRRGDALTSAPRLSRGGWHAAGSRRGDSSEAGCGADLRIPTCALLCSAKRIFGLPGRGRGRGRAHSARWSFCAHVVCRRVRRCGRADRLPAARRVRSGFLVPTGTCCPFPVDACCVCRVCTPSNADRIIFI